MEDELKKLLGTTPTNAAGRGWRCADELQLAAYVDGALDVKARERLEGHLSDCQYCLSQISFLARSSEWPENFDVPPRLVATAKVLVLPVKQRFGIISDWRWTAVAAAACLVAAFILVIAIRRGTTEQPQPNQAESIVPRSEPDSAANPQPSASPRIPDVIAYSSPPKISKRSTLKSESSIPVTRNANPQIQWPRVLFPHDGGAIKRNSLEFRWQIVPDAVFYEVSVMTASGDSVMTQQTDGSVLKVPTDIHLAAGNKYFVSVRAHLREGKTVRSSVVSFRVVE